uniref:Uncharacterized protein n=1 Tax=Knipowitschia caucasica TaxID=637954 RepID=A0AAV2MKZ7_KNICA
MVSKDLRLNLQRVLQMEKQLSVTQAEAETPVDDSLVSDAHHTDPVVENLTRALAGFVYLPLLVANTAVSAESCYSRQNSVKRAGDWRHVSSPSGTSSGDEW